MTHFPHRQSLPLFGANRNPRATYGCATILGQVRQFHNPRRTAAQAFAFAACLALGIAAIFAASVLIGA